MAEAMSEERWREIQSLKYVTEHLSNDKLSAMISDLIAEVELLREENGQLRSEIKEEEACAKKLRVMYEEDVR